MKLLSYLNVSNISSLEADSGYIFSRTVLEELIKCGHEVFFIGPQGMPNIAKEIKIIEIDFPHSKYGVRFGLPWINLQSKLSSVQTDFDIIIVNQSELTIPLAMMIYETIGKRIPCITYYHYLAVQGIENGEIIFDPSLNDHFVGRYIWQRQLESAQFSDHNIIGSEFGKKLFFEAAGSNNGIEDKFSIIPPPVQETKDINRKSHDKFLTILYNHRLYEHYGAREIFQVLEKLSHYHIFKVLVTDPTFKRSVVRDKLDASVNTIKQWIKQLDFVEINHFETQSEYYESIATCVDIALAPWRKGALWSMAMADAMAVGVPIVAPNEGAYFEVVGDQDLIFSSTGELYRILEKLLTNKEYRRIKSLSAQKRTEKISAELIGEKFEEILLSTIEESK